MTKDKLILKLRANKRARQIAANRYAMQGDDLAEMLHIMDHQPYVAVCNMLAARNNIFSAMADELILKRKG